jgi:hypothetical protein
MGETEARQALQEALAGMVDGPSASVSPASYGVSADRLFEIADELRGELRSVASIEWNDDGSLRFDAGLL